MNRDLASHVSTTLRDLIAAVNRLEASVKASATTIASKAHTTATRAVASSVEHGEKLSRSIKAHWDKLSPKHRAARIKRMLAARGLKPKKKGPPSARSLKLKASIKAHWDAMTPAQRAARVKKMLAGRGLKPKATTKSAKPAK